MWLVVDTHYHLYPCHDPARALGALRANLLSAGSRFARGEELLTAAVLADRSDSPSFRDLASGAIEVPGWRVEQLDDLCLAALHDERGEILLLAGRQVATAERLEVLGLAVSAASPDGSTLGDAIRAIAGAGGIPVLPWSAGRWIGGRGAIVRAAVERLGPEQVVLGDTSLRPRMLPGPSLMRRAVKSGFALHAGSDTLPVPGEERFGGCYASVVEGEIDRSRPGESFRAILGPGSAPVRAGTRSGPIEAARRLLAHERSKRRAD